MIPKYEQGLHDALFKILSEVESKLELIEAVDQLGPENLTYRFSRPFFRESIYQRLLFTNQKKFMHKQNASFIQQNPNADYDSEADCLRLTKHFLIAEDVHSEEMLSSTAKQIILIKRITYLLQSKAPIIKQGTLTKQGQRANQKIEYRYVELTPKELKYWHDHAESKTSAALGQIPLKHISNIMPANRMKQTSDFFITAGHWKKKNEEREMREFVFGSDNDSERDEWITAISYLRTQAIQNDFNRKFHFTPPPVVRKEIPRQDATSTISFKSTPVKRISKLIGGGNSGDKRFSFLKQLPDQKDDVELVQQCIKQLFSFSFSHILSHMSEKAVTGRTLDIPFAQQVQSTHNLLFQQSVENLAAKIPRESVISSSPLSGRPSEVKKIQRLPTTIKEEKFSPRKTITEDDYPFKRLSGMHFRRSFTLLSGTSKRTSRNRKGEPSQLEETGKSEEEESDESFKTEFEESEEKQSSSESEESKEEQSEEEKDRIQEQPSEEESEKEEKPRYIDNSEKELNHPREYKSKSNEIDTSTKTEVPRVVFIEKVEKRRHTRMTSQQSTIYRRNLTTLTTPSLKDPPRSPFSIISDGLSHRQTASQSIAQTPQMTPRPGNALTSPVYFMVPPGGKPQYFQFPQGILKGAQVQPNSQPNSPFVFMLPGNQDADKMDLSGISDIAYEGSNTLTQLEDIKAFGQILGDSTQGEQKIRAIAIRKTTAVQNKDFTIEDGEIFDVTGGVLPELGKAGMVKITHENKVGLFTLEDFKLSPPLQKKGVDGQTQVQQKQEPQVLFNDGSKLTLGQNRATGMPIRSGANSRPRSAEKSDKEISNTERSREEKSKERRLKKKTETKDQSNTEEVKASALVKTKPSKPKKIKLTGPLSQFLMRGLSAASSPKEEEPRKKFFGSGTSTETKNSPAYSRKHSKSSFKKGGSSTTPRKKEEKKQKLPKRAVTRFLRPSSPSRGHQQPAQRHTLQEPELLNSSLPLEAEHSPLYSVDVKINKFYPIIQEEQFQSEVSEKPEKRTSKFLKLNNRKKMKNL